MGGSQAKSYTDVDDIQVQIPGFAFVKRVEDDRGNSYNLYKEDQTGLKAIEARLAHQNDSRAMKKLVEKAEAKLNALHPHLQQMLCFVNGPTFMTALFEYIDHDLERDIFGRMTKRQPYTEKELLTIIYSVSAAGKALADMGIPHKDIKPENIYITKDLTVKLSDCWANPANKGGLSQFLQVFTRASHKCYLSPGLFAQMALGPEEPLANIGTTSNEVFSLGLCILEAASLTPVSFAYDLNHFKFNFEYVNQLIQSLGGRYSHSFFGILGRMLSPNDEQRPQFEDLVQMVSPLLVDPQKVASQSPQKPKYHQAPPPIAHVPQNSHVVTRNTQVAPIPHVAPVTHPSVTQMAPRSSDSLVGEVISTQVHRNVVIQDYGTPRGSRANPACASAKGILKKSGSRKNLMTPKREMSEVFSTPKREMIISVGGPSTGRAAQGTMMMTSRYQTPRSQEQQIEVQPKGRPPMIKTSIAQPQITQIVTQTQPVSHSIAMQRQMGTPQRTMVVSNVNKGIASTPKALAASPGRFGATHGALQDSMARTGFRDSRAGEYQRTSTLASPLESAVHVKAKQDYGPKIPPQRLEQRRNTRQEFKENEFDAAKTSIVDFRFEKSAPTSGQRTTDLDNKILSLDDKLQAALNRSKAAMRHLKEMN